MKVKELIEKLNQFDPDMTVVGDGWEGGGADNLTSVSEIKLSAGRGHCQDFKVDPEKGQTFVMISRYEENDIT